MAESLVHERLLSERKVRCDSKKCSQYADYTLNGRVKQFKLCQSCAIGMVVELCDFGYIRRIAMEVINEKGI